MSFSLRRSALNVLTLTTFLASGCTYPGGPYYGYALKSGQANLPAAAPLPSKDTTPDVRAASQPSSTDEFNAIVENDFLTVAQHPLSTFSIDVDTASYSLMRRMLQEGAKPPKGAIRLEEMINYFNYSYPVPSGSDPFSVTTEIASCPWAPDHKLLLVGLQGAKPKLDSLPASNLVFLIDVSGSMQSPDRLPLVQSALLKLVDSLRPQDRVAIVVYAGSAGLVLGATAGDKKAEMKSAIEGLRAGGSTAGGQGIELAYAIAKNNFIAGGNNRVILATDGDFNVGVSSESALLDIIERQRKENIFLTVLGFGMGNFKDNKLELLADKGNGNYAYIDGEQEAKRVFGGQLAGTLFTIAKDVKLQLEFNPTTVTSYRLIGYENRLMRADEFDNDKKDAGELGVGHSVTALFEIVPATGQPQTKALKYQDQSVKAEAKSGTLSKELGTVQLRFKAPTAETSTLQTFAITDTKADFKTASENLRWAASVASFGMAMRDSSYRGTASLDDIKSWAGEAKGSDGEGQRAELLTLIDKFAALNGTD